MTRSKSFAIRIRVANHWKVPFVLKDTSPTQEIHPDRSFKACSLTESTAEAPEDKPSKDIGTGGSKALVEAATRAVLELNYPPCGAVDFHWIPQHQSHTCT